MAGASTRGSLPPLSSSQRTSKFHQSNPLISSKIPCLLQGLQRKRRRQGSNVQQSRSTREEDTPSSRLSMTPHCLETEIMSDEEADESSDHIIMAIDMKEHDTIGCAYYAARQERLFCMEDVTNSGRDILDTLRLDVLPTILLVSPRIDPASKERDPLDTARSPSLIDNDEDLLCYHCEFRPSTEFSYDGAMNKLANLKVLSLAEAGLSFLVPGESNYDETQDPENLGLTNRQGRLLQISTRLDMENKVSIGCVGAVITYLRRKKASEYLLDDPAAELAYRIMEMEMFSLKGTMVVNFDTLVSLEIIQPESHPNAFNQGPGTYCSKESLSIYGLFHHHARTPQGRACLRKYFIRPSVDLCIVNARLDFISVFIRPDNVVSLQNLSKSMSRIKNMRATMTLLHKGVSGGNRKHGGFKSGVWANLLEFCYHTIDIAETLNDVVGAETLPLRARAMRILDKIRLQRVGKIVHDIVDLDASIEQHRTVVKRGIDEKLDKIKDIYDGMETMLSHAAIKIARTLPIDVNLNVIYFPQLGFHISVPTDKLTGQAVYDGGAEPWDRKFTTQNQVYFKDPRMCKMDEELGDLYAMICDIEIEISYDLAQKVLQDKALLIAVSDICGEIDSLLALAHGASQHKLTKPHLTEENRTEIRGGRHLLQEMTVPSYVPNDTLLAGSSVAERAGSVDGSSTRGSCIDGPSTILLTGPNYSGKSVYMKAVALIVYMAHVGCFVPCDAATISLTDKILTRITTHETVSRNQSTFMTELQQVGLAVTQCTRRSLVVIDEFGKGTDSCDGAGLAAGVFKYLLSMGKESPKVLGATHFHEIFDFEQDLWGDSGRLVFAHMEVLVDCKGKQRASDHASQVTYLYNLCEGRSSLSYGTQCAALNGIPYQIVERARKLAELVIQGEDLVTTCAAISEDEEKEFLDAEEVARSLLELDIAEIADDDLSGLLGGLLRCEQSTRIFGL